jgi:hypothetical protein
MPRLSTASCPESFLYSLFYPQNKTLMLEPVNCLKFLIFTFSRYISSLLKTNCSKMSTTFFHVTRSLTLSLLPIPNHLHYKHVLHLFSCVPNLCSRTLYSMFKSQLTYPLHVPISAPLNMFPTFSPVLNTCSQPLLPHAVQHVPIPAHLPSAFPI